MQLSRLQQGIIRSSVPLKRLPFQLLSYNQILEVLTVLDGKIIAQNISYMEL